MLVSIINLLNMTGGNIPPTPTTQSGDGVRKHEHQQNEYEDQKRKRITDEDNWFIPQVIEKILRECL